MRLSFISRIFLLSLIFLPLYAQAQSEVSDTLKAAKISSLRNLPLLPGDKPIDLAEALTHVSSFGEGDVIRFVQTMPGVATGAEGSSAIYVRGGNLGNNVMTLDGVRLYGVSHLFGFSSIYPMEIIERAGFKVGGFSSEENNLTASHIKLETKDGRFDKKEVRLFASNFIAGGYFSTPVISKKFSLSGALRISPAQMEYALIKKQLSQYIDSLDNMELRAGDAFLKAAWKPNSKNTVSLSSFGSIDRYILQEGGAKEEMMQWNNLIVSALWKYRGRVWNHDAGISYNSFSSRQSQENILSGMDNVLAMKNSIKEEEVKYSISRSFGDHFSAKAGIKSTWSEFNPGASTHISGSKFLIVNREEEMVDNTISTTLSTLHAQVEYHLRDLLVLTAAGRLNKYSSSEIRIKRPIDKEYSLSGRICPLKWFSIEITADNVMQYTHTLEGLPLGWSLDMVVPVTEALPPERAQQYFAGLVFSHKTHYLSIGAYTKKMSSLVFFSDASAIFSPAISTWKKNVVSGKGSSRGIEIQAEEKGEKARARIAYTLSKTDRFFPDLNRGRVFPATFDRTHILNAEISYSILKTAKKSLGANTFVTYQSGRYETVAAGEYPVYRLMGEVDPIEWFFSVNNYRMPYYFRWDIGLFYNVFREKCTHEMYFGVYNLLNRHNPFVITFDTEVRKWKQISLLPVMPSLRYSIKF